MRYLRGSGRSPIQITTATTTSPTDALTRPLASPAPVSSTVSTGR